jgi:protoporphyrinogen oxidase
LITVIGAGLSGLSAAYHLGSGHFVMEREAEVGGLCRSVATKGYVFDLAPHIFFTGNQYVRDLTGNLLQGNLVRQARRAYIYLEGTYVEYPFEVNLYGLPRETIEECLSGFKERSETQPRNFLEWINSTFGSGIARHYMVPYNEKVWKYPLDRMDVDWIAGRVPAPSIDEMVRGAGEKVEKEYGPNAYFLYPRRGGIGAIANALAGKVGKVSLNSEAVEIDPRGPKGVRVTYKGKDGVNRTVESDAVLSSMPLPEVVKIIKDAPQEVVEASERLVHNSLICVNIGVNRPRISDKHWLYFPEKRYIFNRVSFPMNFSEETTPRGRSSILVEVTYRGNRPDLDETKFKVREGLIEAGIMRKNDEVDVFEALDFKYAYVINDLDHRRNTAIIHDCLSRNRVHPIGRFGEWGYLNMDRSILSGKEAAEKIGVGAG